MAGRRGGDWRLFLVACLGGALYFASLGRLWPLAPGNLLRPPDQLKATARDFLRARGLPTDGYDAATSLVVDEAALDDLERRFGQERTQSLLAAGDAPAVNYEVGFKKAGEASTVIVLVNPMDGRVVGWRRTLQDDEPGGRISTDAARALLRSTLKDALGLDLTQWREAGVSVRDYPARRDHVFTFEHTRIAAPELTERLSVRVAGDRLSGALRSVALSPASQREARSRDAARQTLNMAGLLLLSLAILGAFAVFLLRLRDGSARLRRAAFWSGAVFACTMGAALLQGASVFQAWDPLWPKAVSYFQYLLNAAQNEIWTLLILVAVVAAGDALDRAGGTTRGESLWLLTQGKLRHPLVGAAAGRGFLIGLICGGVMAGAVLLLTTFAGARVALQPRAFFFFALNSSYPGASTLLYFLHVALLEELGYRYFSGQWLDAVTKRRWVAIVAPAVVYGLTHTTLGFLPPAEPFWARAFVMTLIGAVWGWAFFRYDALTVVISHLTADLFILNWPRLASGDPLTVVSAVLTVATPLLPAALSLPSLVRRRQNG